MHETGVKLLKMMFRDGETICVSHNEYGYHSLPLENAISEQVTLVPTPESIAKRNEGRKERGQKLLVWEECFETLPTDKMLLVALNPIQGWRKDIYCTKFRNFLIELDVGPLAEQLAYIKSIGVPYSAVVFSGNKSLHFLISLDRDLPSEKVYRVFSQWLVKSITLADQNTINPSRSIRIPGAFREPGKQQRLVELKGPVKVDDLVQWLNQYPENKPQDKKKREINNGPVEYNRVKQWVIDLLKNGLKSDKGRNKQWFSIACEFALAGYSEDDTFEILEGFFQEDRDFKHKEFETAVKSGFKYIYDRK